MAAFITAGSLIARARALLQDTVEPYRVPTPDLLSGLNEACMEAKRLRPDLFMRTFGQSDIPVFSDAADSIVDKIPEEFHPAFIYYMTGNAQLRDEEENQDQRATIFLNKFVAQLTTIPS